MASDYVRKVKPSPEEQWEAGMVAGSRGGDGAQGIQENHDRAFEDNNDTREALNDRFNNFLGWISSIDGVDNHNKNVDFIAGTGITIVPDNVAKTITFTSGYARRKKVIDYVDNTAAPPTEVSGDRYILDFTGASHADWDGAAVGDIVEFNGFTWDAVSPVEGWVVYVDLEGQDRLYVDDGVPDWEPRGNEIGTAYGRIELPIHIWDNINQGAKYRIPNNCPVWSFVSDATKYIAVSLRIPNDIDLTVNPKLAFMMAPRSARTSGSGCVFTSEIRYVDTTEVLSKGVDESPSTTDTVPNVANERFDAEIILDKTKIEADDLMTLSLERTVGDVSDDRNGEIYIMWAAFVYKKSKLNEVA